MWRFESVYRPEIPEMRTSAFQSRLRRVWNQGEALYGIRNLLRYGIITKWCMSSIRRKNTRYRVMPYACGDYIHDYVVITYQSFGLDRKKHLLAQVLFSGRGSRIRTYEWGSQSPLPYRLAIPLFETDLTYSSIKSARCQVAIATILCLTSIIRHTEF